MIILKKILPIAIIVAVVGGGAYFFLIKKGGGVASKLQSFTSLKAAVELGVPMKCSYKVEGAEYEGYIKGKQWRGKMKSADGKFGEVILKDNCMWSWTSEDAQGLTMCFEPEEGEDDVWDQQDMTDVEYNCVPTAITDAKFDPPSNIKFLNLQEMMQQGI